jgi:hypothetical protein
VIKTVSERRDKVLFLDLHSIVQIIMPENSVPPTIFHILERNIGRKVLAILDPAYGFEGVLAAVTREPPGIWLSDASATILRSTIAQPIPQVVSREHRSEIYVNLSSVQRIELLHEK